MTPQCPCCGRQQDAWLLCHSCSTKLEQQLGDVRSLWDDLQITLSKQDRMASDGKGGLASQRNNVNWNASITSADLTETLLAWAVDVAEPDWQLNAIRPVAVQAAWAMLRNIPTIRTHQQVTKLVDEVTYAVERARSCVLGPANRTIIYVGHCPEPDDHNRPCMGEVFAYIPRQDKPGRMTCKTNGEHSWASSQWLSAAKRIADLEEELKQAAA